MAAFKTELHMVPLRGGRWWRLMAPLVYESDVLGREITVPSGFECDLNSMPWLTWLWAPKTDYPEAGAVHDWGYQGNLSQADADAVYREALGVPACYDKDNCVPAPWRRTGRYYTLRLLGRFAYGVDDEPRS